MSIEVVYSSICDVDSVAYRQFLTAWFKAYDVSAVTGVPVSIVYAGGVGGVEPGRHRLVEGVSDVVGPSRGTDGLRTVASVCDGAKVSSVAGDIVGAGRHHGASFVGDSEVDLDKELHGEVLHDCDERDSGEPHCGVRSDGPGVAAKLERSEPCVGGVNTEHGPNYVRNLATREKKKKRKQLRQKMNVDWRSGEKCSVVDQEVDKKGFWNSCSEAVRQELIDSKARMHIAQNEQKAQEAKERVEAMKSPVAIMKKAVALAEQASKIAKKEGDSKVMGWAQTVATSEAESLARSTPSSVPSFDEIHKSVSDVDVEEVVTPDSSLVSENENLKAKMKAMQLEKKQEGERVAVEKHAAVLARVAELEKQVLVQQRKKKPAYNDIVCDGMTEWQIKDLKKKNEALEREVDDAYRWKAKQDVVKQGVTGSIWFGKQAAKK